MGVDTRRPVLPAPTESIVDTTGDSATGTDLATDLSRRTDKTSYSIPDDGSPITVPTRRHRDRDDQASRSHRDSQTSLLIEYFEGGKGPGGVVSRPSVRVRVTPSAARKFKDKDHIQITESGSRHGNPAFTRRISLSSPSSKQKPLADSVDDQSVSSGNSAEEAHQHSSRRPPVEIEFMNREPGSELSTVSRDTRYMAPSSDISSMPPDSMVEGASSAGARRKRSQSLERGSPREDKDLLKTPSRQRSRSLSKERIAHRVAEKLSGSPQETSSGKQKSRSRNKSAGKDYLEADPKSAARRRRHQSGHDEMITSPESSLLSASAVSGKSGDQYSIRSGASKSSINNPKLLETVEDAIRRLILPELKELKKDQKVMSNKSKFERDLTTSYSSPSSRDELGRRLSKHASAPDVMKPKVVLNKDSKDEGIVLAGESGPRSKERKSSKSSETSDSAWVKWGRPELTEQDKLRRQKSKGLRDAQAAARVGSALTAASLKHHDSQSSIGESERRGSGSKKSVDNFNETELLFQKHNVPAMPMRSEIDSELTRTSLLSERTESPAPKKISHAEVSRGSPRQSASPKSRTPTRTLDSRYELGMRHGNQSHHNLSIHSASDRDLRGKSQSPGTDGGGDWAIAAAAAANLLDAAQPGHRDSVGEQYEGGRALSPIQSVASDRTETHGAHYSTDHYPEGKKDMEPRLSIDSLSSAPSTNLARSTRNEGVSPGSRSREGLELGYEGSRHASREKDVYRPEEEESRRSLDDEDSEVDFMDKIKEGQRVTGGAAANPQFVHPVGVESAVASLMDPSVLESQTTQSNNRSQTDVADRADRAASRSPEKAPSEGYRGSPLKQHQSASSPDETSFPRRMGVTSPPQSVTQSIEDIEEAGATREIQSPHEDADVHSQESESEINTNPSIIQGPIGGVAQGNPDHWGYESRSPGAGQVSYYDSGAVGGAKDLSPGQQRGLDAEYYETARNIFGGDDYIPDQRTAQLFGTPPGAKDEGYVSAANPMSPSIGTPKQGTRGLGGAGAAGMASFDSPTEADDPFAPGHQRHFSGYSHGVGSPLYDSATGRGIERIQSKDIVALMDHVS